MAEPLCFRQPFKGLYILQRTLSTLVLVPYWTIKYSRASSRPRRTWTLSETVYVMALRRMMRINEVTGIMLECTDKTEEVDDSSLQETSFVWLPPIEDHLVEGAAKSEDVKSTRIPGYAWPRGINLAESHGYVGYWASYLRFTHLWIYELTNNRSTEVHIGQLCRSPTVKCAALDNSSGWGMEQKNLVPSVGCMVFASRSYLTQGIPRNSEVHQQGQLSTHDTDPVGSRLTRVPVSIQESNPVSVSARGVRWPGWID